MGKGEWNTKDLGVEIQTEDFVVRSRIVTGWNGLDTWSERNKMEITEKSCYKDAGKSQKMLTDTAKMGEDCLKTDTYM